MSIQLHDSFTGHATGCSETRTAAVRSVLDTRIPMRLFTLYDLCALNSSVVKHVFRTAVRELQFSSCAVNIPLLTRLHHELCADKATKATVSYRATWSSRRRLPPWPRSCRWQRRSTDVAPARRRRRRRRTSVVQRRRRTTTECA